MVEGGIMSWMEPRLSMGFGLVEFQTLIMPKIKGTLLRNTRGQDIIQPGQLDKGDDVYYNNGSCYKQAVIGEFDRELMTGSIDGHKFHFEDGWRLSEHIMPDLSFNFMAYETIYNNIGTTVTTQ